MLKLTVALLLVALCQGTPVLRTRTKADLSLMEGDMRFPPGFDHKSGIVGDQYRWPNNEVVYEIDGAFSQSERNVVLQGIQEITSKTCITFRQRGSGDSNYAFIERGGSNTGCWSYVGRQGGRQVVNLQAPDCPQCGHCIWSGTVAHELIHAIGYFHEQSRPDRDDWVTINWGNIPTDVQYNFDKMSSGEVDTFNTPYDYASIMHYDAYAFAADPSQPTIIPKQSGAQLGGDIVTGYDRQKINNMYEC